MLNFSFWKLVITIEFETWDSNLRLILVSIYAHIIILAYTPTEKYPPICSF